MSKFQNPQYHPYILTSRDVKNPYNICMCCGTITPCTGIGKKLHWSEPLTCGARLCRFFSYTLLHKNQFMTKLKVPIYVDKLVTNSVSQKLHRFGLLLDFLRKLAKAYYTGKLKSSSSYRKDFPVDKLMAESIQPSLDGIFGIMFETMLQIREEKIDHRRVNDICRSAENALKAAALSLAYSNASETKHIRERNLLTTNS